MYERTKGEEDERRSTRSSSGAVTNNGENDKEGHGSQQCQRI